MHLNDIQAPWGAKKRRKIVGRGKGSGRGKTSCRGVKGQTSRSGRWVIGPREGGQMRLIRRLPKVGFRSRRPVLNQIVTLENLKKFKDGTEITAEFLKSEGLIHSINKPFKILADGDINKALVIRGGSISETAKDKIIKAGGKIELIDNSIDNAEVKPSKSADNQKKK